MTTIAAHALSRFRPLATPADPQARQALQAARRRSALTWLAGGVVAAHLAALASPWFLPSASGWVWFGLAALVTAGMLTAGAVQLILFARADPRRLGSSIGVAALAGFALLLTPLAGLLAILLGLAHLLLPLVVAACGVGLLAAGPSKQRLLPRPWAATALGLLGAAIALAVGVLDSLVLLPTTMMPGMPLAEIWAGLAAAGEDGGTWVPIAWAALWAVGLVLLAFGLLRRRASQRGALGALLAAGAIALAALPAVQFSIGMGISDTWVTGGGLSAAFPAITLGAVLLVALAGGLLIGASQRSD